MDNIEDFFTLDALFLIYTEHILFSFATGIDNLNQKAFYDKLNEELFLINKKVLNGNYKFTKYKLKLISKGRAKNPREISIPTIRDRVTLRVICNILIEKAKASNNIKFELPQDTIRAVKADLYSGRYNSFMKLDVESFYPSINHEYLVDILKSLFNSDNLINLIINAIKTPTVIKSSQNDKPNTCGVPQGLSISNILAALYLGNIDRDMFLIEDIKYYRYVDDILVLSKVGDQHKIFSDIDEKFKNIGLSLHNPYNNSANKSVIGNVNFNDFDYLGYRFLGGKVSVRFGSIDKLKESLVSIFTGYKYSQKRNKDFLLWRLNLRVTGCIFENKSKGWLFFFSEINDESLLHQLDIYVESLVKRFNVLIQPKKFVRAFFEVNHNKYHSKYIPNFDTYSLEKMKEVLRDYFKKDIVKMNDEEVKYEFRRRIQRQAKDLLADVQAVGGSG